MRTSESYWIDGRLVSAAEAGIAPDDQGFTVGLAVFETLLWEERHLDFVERHLERMQAGARALAIAWPPPWDLRVALAEYTATLADAPRAVRATLTRGRPGAGPSFVIGSRPVDVPPADGVVLALNERRLSPAEPGERRVKSTNRIDYCLAREEARAAGAWDALLQTTEGDVAEATIANVFAVVEGALVTPPLERGCLPGVVRSLVLESLRDAPLAGPTGALLRRAGVREARLELSALARAEEVFLTNTTGRVIGVRAVSDVGTWSAPGPLARAVRERLAELEAADRARGRAVPRSSR